MAAIEGELAAVVGKRRGETGRETLALRAVGTDADELRLPGIAFVGLRVEALILLHHERDHTVLTGERRARDGRDGEGEGET
jgi:hypothetical protein